MPVKKDQYDWITQVRHTNGWANRVAYVTVVHIPSGLSCEVSCENHSVHEAVTIAKETITAQLTYEPEVGMVLCTLNPQSFTNAIAVGIEDNNVTVISDFGNIRTLSKEDLPSYYQPSKAWLESKLIEYPVDSPVERIHKQISLLENALDRLG